MASPSSVRPAAVKPGFMVSPPASYTGVIIPGPVMPGYAWGQALNLSTVSLPASLATREE
jgi:hypothetical protein